MLLSLYFLYSRWWVFILTHLSLETMAAILQMSFWIVFLMHEKFCVLIWISLKFVPKGPIDNTSVLVQVIAWCWSGYELLPEQVLVQFTDAYMWH